MILQVVEIPSRQFEKVITDTRLSLSSFQSTIALTYNDDGQPSATHTHGTASEPSFPFPFLFFFFFFETLVVHEIGSGDSTSQSVCQSSES